MWEREKNDGGHLQKLSQTKTESGTRGGGTRQRVCLCFVSREEEKGRKKKRTNKQLVMEEENEGERLVI